MRGRMDRRDNNKCFFGGCRSGLCVFVGRHCEEYMLVGLVGWFLDNIRVIEYGTFESVELIILIRCR